MEAGAIADRDGWSSSVSDGATPTGATALGVPENGVAAEPEKVTAGRSGSWFHARIARTSDSLDRAFEEGLTGHRFKERSGKRLTLEDGTEAVEFVSCSYLGLEQHPALLTAAIESVRRFGVHFSSSRNRMQPPYLAELEGLLGEMYGGRPVVCFTSVSNIHLGVLPLLAAGGLGSYPISAEGPMFLIEKTAHASMQALRGIMEQLGPVSRFDLADEGSLPDRLRLSAKEGRTPIVLVDGVGSMGGLIDVAGLHELIRPYGGHLYIDDAHGVSISGDRGVGYAFAALGYGLPPGVMLAGSLSKAFGGAGGFVVLPHEDDVRVIRKLANPLVFGHSIMLPMLAADVASARLHLDGEVAGLQQRLWDRVALFDGLTGGKLVNAGLESPVRGALFPTEESAFDAARRLRAAGVLVLPAFFPTVAQGTGLIRFAVSAAHEDDHLRTAAEALGVSAW